MGTAREPRSASIPTRWSVSHSTMSGVALPIHTETSSVPAFPQGRDGYLQMRVETRNPPLWWLGTHGGAGESTLAMLHPQWLPADHVWPFVNSLSARVCLVARTNMSGLLSAQRAMAQWASGTVPRVEVVGLALIADAPGKLPRSLREFADIIAGGVPRRWNLPWEEAWRLGYPAQASGANRAVRGMLSDLQAIVSNTRNR